MTRYKLEVEFDAENMGDAFDFISHFSMSGIVPGEGLALYTLRDLEGTFKMSAQFTESLEAAPILPTWTHRSDGTSQYGTVNRFITDAQQAEIDATPAPQVNDTLKTMAGL